MDGSSRKKAASGKGEKDRTPALFKDLLEKCQVNNLEVFVIPAILNQKPKPGQMWTTYLLEKESISANSCENLEEIIKVYLAFPNFEKSGQPQRIYIKNTKVSSNFLNVLCTVLRKYMHITTLKLMDCNLSKLAIEILHYHLQEMPNITEIALDGNPTSAQNHGLLASSDTLKYLSLKRCKINEIGMEYLFQNLMLVQQSHLELLNLTGNYINDNGAAVIGKILRENRSISTLILADNWITDVGCYSIMNALQSFILTDVEVIRRRSITINYFRQKIKMTEQYKKDNLHIKIPVTPPPSAKSKKSGKSKKKEPVRKTLVNEMNKQVSDYVENILPKITHPFICDTESVNGDLICSGNLVLGYLNLAYNKLTTQGYKYILEMLNYQLAKEQIAAGLLYVVLNGNLDLRSYEFEEITRIVTEKLWNLETIRYRSSKASADMEAGFFSSTNSTP